MKNKSKILCYTFLALAIGATSCSPPTQDQLERERLINQVKDNTLSIPSINTGGVSGTISYINLGGAGSSSTAGEVRIRIVRQNDIPKVNAAGRPVDTSGREFVDPKTQTQAFLEKKNDVIKNEVLTYKDRYSITGIRPGDVAIVITSGSEETQQNVKVSNGTITEVPNIILGSAAKTGTPTRIGINIKGRVLRPDGTPVANAKVSDVTQNAISSSTTTNAQGEFSLQVSSFTKPKNLEATFNNITTSITVQPEQTEDILIPLLTNARTIKGRLIDSVNKKPIADISIKSVDSNSSTSTNSNGEFILRGAPTSVTTLEVGPKSGYVVKQQVVAASEQETTLSNLEIIPLGNMIINLTIDNYPDRIDFPDAQKATVPSIGSGLATPFLDTVNGVGALNVPCVKSTTQTLYYISNPFAWENPVSGTIQIEGTDIVKEFTVPPTPSIAPKPECGIGDNKESITVFLPNYLIAVPVNNLPGGEYTISVSASFHETQKGIKVVVPSRDTIATELIQLRAVKRILAIGDVVGSVLIKDLNGNPVDTTGNVRVLALKGEVDLRNPAILARIFSDPQTEIDSQNGYVSSFTDLSIAGSSTGQYILKNVPTGTRALVAGVVDSSGNLVSDYLISSYTSLNVVGNTINRAPDIIINKR